MSTVTRCNRITIEGSQVVVRNMIRAYRVDLARIARVRPGDDGVAIYTDTGQKIVARAISQDFLAKAMRRRTMADDLADAIATAVRYAAGEPAPQAAKAIPLAARWLVLVIVTGLGSLVGTALSRRAGQGP